MATLPTHFDNTLGAMEIGMIVSSVLFGCIVVQSYMFYERSARDTVWTKSVVACLVLLDVLHIIFSSNAVYFYTVTNYLNPVALTGYPWSIPAQIALTTIAACVSQCFFASRVWLVSRKNKILTVAIVTLAVTQMAFGLYAASQVAITKLVSRIHEYAWSMIAALSCAAACDIIITGSLCVYFNSARTGFKSTETLINRLIVWTMSTGLITMVFAIIDLICVVSLQNNLVYVGVFFVISKLYTNCVLASLNVRESIRRTGKASVNTTSTFSHPQQQQDGSIELGLPKMSALVHNLGGNHSIALGDTKASIAM